MEQSDYEKTAAEFCARFGVKVKAGRPDFRKHFPDDDRERFVFPVTVSRGGRRMRVAFGQSLAAGRRPPTAYEVLSCMTKTDPGTFEAFCRDYGYDDDSRKAEKTWKACSREWVSVSRVFGGGECLKAFQEIT